MAIDRFDVIGISFGNEIVDGFSCRVFAGLIGDCRPDINSE